MKNVSQKDLSPLHLLPQGKSSRTSVTGLPLPHRAAWGVSVVWKETNVWTIVHVMIVRQLTGVSYCRIKNEHLQGLRYHVRSRLWQTCHINHANITHCSSYSLPVSVLMAPSPESVWLSVTTVFACCQHSMHLTIKGFCRSHQGTLV